MSDRDSPLPASNEMRSVVAYRNYMRAAKQSTDRGQDGLSLAAQRWREMSPEHRARYCKPTSALGGHDLEPSYDTGFGMKPKKGVGSCGKGKSKDKRSKSSIAKRRRRKSAAKRGFTPF